MAHHQHHHHQSHGFCSPAILRLVLFTVSVWLVGYIVGPRLYRHFSGRFSTTAQASSFSSSSCPPCVCGCASENILKLPLDCAKDDPNMKEELEKDMIDLLSEELILQQNVTHDSIEHTRESILEAKKTSSHYQKEADKCNAGMETCEEARERAEAELRAECKLSILWEERAREHGWRDLRRMYS